MRAKPSPRTDSSRVPLSQWVKVGKDLIAALLKCNRSLTPKQSMGKTQTAETRGRDQLTRGKSGTVQTMLVRGTRCLSSTFDGHFGYIPRVIQFARFCNVLIMTIKIK
jgi:hypothetical protein